jgi:hypothetical protein
MNARQAVCGGQQKAIRTFLGNGCGSRAFANSLIEAEKTNIILSEPA